MGKYLIYQPVPNRIASATWTLGQALGLSPRSSVQGDLEAHVTLYMFESERNDRLMQQVIDTFPPTRILYRGVGIEQFANDAVVIALEKNKKLDSLHGMCILGARSMPDFVAMDEFFGENYHPHTIIGYGVKPNSVTVGSDITWFSDEIKFEYLE